MKFPTPLLLLLLLFLSIVEVIGQNSWATHLRRSAKRIANVRRSLISRGLAKKAAVRHGDPVPQEESLRRRMEYLNRRPKKTSSFMAAESGYGYMAKQYEDRQAPPTASRYYAPPVYETGNCYGKLPGMIGSPEYRCKVFHICQADGRLDKMYCPASLRFNNYLGVCDWPNKVDEYCNPIYYYSERPKRPPTQYRTENGPYPPSREYEMSYAAAEKYSTRTKTEAEQTGKNDTLTAGEVGPTVSVH